MRKGQASTEVLFIIGVVLLIFMIALYLINMRKEELTFDRYVAEEKMICDDLYERITSVATQPNLNTTYYFNANISITAKSDLLVLENYVTYFCYLPLNITNGTSRFFVLDNPVGIRNLNNEVIIT